MARLHLATHKGLITYEGSDTDWRLTNVAFLGHNVTIVLSDPRSGMLFAALALGHFGVKLHRSSDGGKTWDECGVPVYPEGATIAPHPMAEPGAPLKPAALSEIWALEPGGTDQPGQLWAGTIPGGLFKSLDNGATWELVESLWNAPEREKWFGGGKDDAGIHSVCVDPRNSRHVTMGVSCGGVWETQDNGDSWELLGEGLRADFMPPDLQGDKTIQDVHRLVSCPSDPDKMWIQHHNGIFRSTDAARTWTELQDVQPSSFGFAVCVDPNNGDRAWFVPGVKDECRVPVDQKLTVLRTDDGGQTFISQRSGLPQQDCFDIVFRHGLDIDSTGRKLAFGSSTGGLWITENAGDHWHCVSNTLPQIYCVQWDRTEV
ncbi:MAG: exo-alpha-sialidase [Planctomycetaceae bacterium]|nr:exo-alpha-sialidase [Planctomycetaceae bacterium]